MADLKFEISYSAPALPAWEASRTLRGITHLYYCVLVAHDGYPAILDQAYKENGEFIPEDLTARLKISESDQLFLEVQSLSPRLAGRVSSGNERAAKNTSDALQVLKKLREEVRSKGMADKAKMERIEASSEIQQLLLEPISKIHNLGEHVKSRLRTIALLACLAIVAELIESIELGFTPSG